MATNIQPLVDQLTATALTDKAYKASDSLARIGSGEVIRAMIALLQHPNPESRIMAARTLGMAADNGVALEPLLEAVNNPENKAIAGDLFMALEGFDVSEHYLDLFKLYLFGSFKVSAIAKNLLDYKEFDITPRVIKKAQKHWNHYANNVKQDESYELKKSEVEDILNDLRAYLE
ncbi:MAG: HEAT repeat domain-containing protein [Cyclobacteriaceae bacterium]|nr:HEAT repeat domain-containing protein [Cyclobacteriaceae bacterium]